MGHFCMLWVCLYRECHRVINPHACLACRCACKHVPSFMCGLLPSGPPCSVHVSARAASMCVRVETMQLVADYATCCIVSRYSIPLCTGHDTSIPKACKLAYSHDTKHTLMHRFFGDAQGQGLDDNHQHRPTGHEADTSLHLGICARVVSAPSDLASGRPSASC